VSEKATAMTSLDD